VTERDPAGAPPGLPGSEAVEARVDPEAPLPPGAIPSSRFQAIYEVGRQLLEQRAPAAVLQAIHECIVEHLRPDHACVLALAPGGAYRPVASHALDLAGPVESWPVSRTILETVRREAVAVLASRAELDRQFRDAGSIQRLDIRSSMCVPLGKAPVRGLIYLDKRAAVGGAGGRGFDPHDLEFLSAISRYASLLLQRAEDDAVRAEALELQDERLRVLQDELLRHQIVGRSPKLLAAYDTVRRLARSGARVLLRGETGTGKELFARAYAAHSPRSAKGYIPVPIPALAPSLVESELFGHARGAFTEAARDKKGRLELAHGGVLFLDEIGDVEPALQVKLLRFLDSGELYRVGETDARRVDALVVSATNRPLEDEVKSGRFRADLFARLGHVVQLPALRERPSDVPLLVEHFLAAQGRSGRAKRFSPEALEVLCRHSWPFNIRELQLVVQRAVLLVDHDEVGVDDLPEELRRGQGQPAPARDDNHDPQGRPLPLKELTDRVTRDHIVRTLAYTRGNKRRAIEILGIAPETFYRRLDELGLRRPDAAADEA